MDTIRYLLSLIIKLAFGLFFLAFIIWMIGFLYPQFKFSNLISGGVFSRDWLPAPKNYGSLLGGRTTTGVNGKVYVPNAPYNGYDSNAYYASQEGVDFIIYTDSGTKIVKAKGSATGNATNMNSQPTMENNGPYSERSLYVRNLSLYEGGNISYGSTFTGEARGTMFKNGIFPLLIVDRNGKVLASTQAINTGTWAIPGWSRFQATIPTRLPAGTECALIFLSATQSVKVGMAVKCN